MNGLSSSAIRFANLVRDADDRQDLLVIAGQKAEDLKMSDWLRRKAARANAYFRWHFGWRRRDCTACNGSGRYDHNGSPRCGGCDGTGKELFRGPLSSENVFERHNPRLFAVWKESHCGVES